MKVFIKEEHIHYGLVLVEVPSEGMGAFVSPVDLNDLVRGGFIKPEVITKNLFKVVEDE